MAIRIRTLIIASLVAAAAGGTFVYLGIYNIAATEQHTAPVYWLLDYAMRRSVKNFSADIEPPALSEEARVRNGFRIYSEKCQQCHGAPGVAPDALAFGLRPAPANLAATAREWSVTEIYWVVRNGVKMSGMPGWEYRLTDDEIWDVVAFVRRLPAFSPKGYAEWASAAPPRSEARLAPAPDEAVPSAGNAEAGKRAIGQYLCATCHSIPGVVGASKHVGPPLEGMANRKYIAGVLPNTQENMVRWLRDPQRIDPRSAMPALGVTEKDARNMAAYLSTLD
ncbi:c-type cytochrome [Noviherbaspirillum sp. ST9]|uniref:c-type cytochrome n=1 Tax=Noviherbaspirillum sp. ST9 TaxID=3401606 RepID=UPI003B588E03